jgi:hypothetical protein
LESSDQLDEKASITTPPEPSLPVDSADEYENQIKNAISLLDGIDNNEKNRIIIED